jgi:hypothetical protein
MRVFVSVLSAALLLALLSFAAVGQTPEDEPAVEHGEVEVNIGLLLKRAAAAQSPHSKFRIVYTVTSITPWGMSLGRIPDGPPPAYRIEGEYITDGARTYLRTVQHVYPSTDEGRTEPSASVFETYAYDGASGKRIRNRPGAPNPLRGLLSEEDFGAQSFRNRVFGTWRELDGDWQGFEAGLSHDPAKDLYQVTFEAGTKGASVRLTIDPNRSFNVVKYEEFDSVSGVPLRRNEYNFMRLDSGAWYVRERIETSYLDSQPFLTVIATVTAVEIDPEVSEDVFDLELPAGIEVARL